MTEPITTPEPFASIIDAVCDRDRAYFEANPCATEYCRAFVPGELWPLDDDAAYVIVTQVAPGVRSRAFVARPTLRLVRGGAA